MATKVPIFVICCCDEANLKKKMIVPPTIALADLVEEVVAEFGCSQDIELWRVIDDSNSILLVDPLDLSDKPKIKAAKKSEDREDLSDLQPEADEMHAFRAMAAKHHLWLDSDGEVLQKIRVYFDNQAPEDVRFKGKELTAEVVVSLASEYWKCDDVTDEKGNQIGGKVPHFVLRKEKEFSDVVVKFYDGEKYALTCSSACLIGSMVQNHKSLKKDDDVVFIDVSSRNDDRILWNILHEFGHVLGLYHEHQHPDYIKVMKEFTESRKLYDFLKEKQKKYLFRVFQAQHDPVPFSVHTMQYDPDSIMHYPTHLEGLNKHRTWKNIEDVKASDNISRDQLRILEGFMANVGRVRKDPQPSLTDKRTVAKAYYTVWERTHPQLQPSREASSPIPPPDPPPSGKRQVRSSYQGISYPELQHLSFMRLGDDRFKLLPQIAMKYQDVAAVLQLEDHKRDLIETAPRENRITEVLKHWTQNAAGGYPVTWQGLYDILNDSELRVVANKFFDFLEKHETQ